MGKPAQQLTKAVTSYLQAKGWMLWKGGTGGADYYNSAGKKRHASFGTPGAPDLFALKMKLEKPKDYIAPNGVEEFCIFTTKLLGIEIKAGKDRQSAKQKEFQKEFEAHGGTYIIVRKTEDLDEYV